MYCKNCGKRAEADDAFCAECGTLTEEAADIIHAVWGKLRLKKRGIGGFFARFFLFVLMCLPFLAVTFLSVYVVPVSEIFVAAVMAEIFLAMILWILLHAGMEYRRLGLKNITVTLLDTREGASGKEKFYTCELLVDNMNAAAKKINVAEYVRNAVWFYGKGRARLRVKKCAFQSLPLPPAQTKIVCEIVAKKNAALQRLRLLSGGALVERNIGEAAEKEKAPARVKTPKEAREYASRGARVFRDVVTVIMLIAICILFFRQQIGI